MIDKFCEYLTNKIRKKMPEVDDEQAEIILYGIQLIVGEMPKIVLLFALGIILGLWWQTLLSFFLILPYRIVSGGFHLKTHLGCIISTNLIYCGNALLSTMFQFTSYTIKYIVIACIFVFAVMMISLYAPADTENLPILTKKERKTKKILSYIFLIINLAVSIFVPNKVISNILIFGTLIQTLSITRLAYKLTKNEYGYENYIKQNTVA